MNRKAAKTPSTICRSYGAGAKGFFYWFCPDPGGKIQDLDRPTLTGESKNRFMGELLCHSIFLLLICLEFSQAGTFNKTIQGFRSKHLAPCCKDYLLSNLRGTRACATHLLFIERANLKILSIIGVLKTISRNLNGSMMIAFPKNMDS